MTHPVSRAFNAAVLTIAAKLMPTGYDVSANAPNDHEALKAHFLKTGRICVYSGDSDATIFADREVNWAFRAWHDWCHLTGNHAFTLQGELDALAMQKEHVIALYGAGPQTDYWLALLEAEIKGQALYFQRFGAFPIDQTAFDLAWVHNPAMLEAMLSGQRPLTARVAA